MKNRDTTKRGLQKLQSLNDRYKIEWRKDFLFTPLESPAACPVRILASVEACSGGCRRLDSTRR